MNYEDLCQQGYLILAELESKIDWEQGPKAVSKFVKKSLGGLMKRYVAQMRQTVSSPSLGEEDSPQISVIRDDIECADCDDPEQQYLKKEKVAMAQKIAEEIMPRLSIRQLYVFYNHMISDIPDTYREIAEKFNCSPSSIGRDVKLITALLQGEAEDED